MNDSKENQSKVVALGAPARRTKMPDLVLPPSVFDDQVNGNNKRARDGDCLSEDSMRTVSRKRGYMGNIVIPLSVSQKDLDMIFRSVDKLSVTRKVKMRPVNQFNQL